MAKKNYKDWTKEDLIKEVEALKKQKTYGLVWDRDKTKEVFDYYINWDGIKTEEKFPEAEHKFPVLKEVMDKIITTDKQEEFNLLIEGDNYHALAVLNFTHNKRVDVIYIDPPYNTGAKDWKYNNDFVEAEDPYRHSKWLSFMEKRLILAKNLLKENGVICVTIDDYECPRLWCLMDEIFGEENHLGTVVIRNNPKGRKTERKVSLIHEYALFYGKKSSKIEKLPIEPEDKTHSYKQDTDGTWYLPVNLRKQGVDSLAISKKGKLSNRYYPIYFDPKSGRISSTVKLPIKILPVDVNGEKRIWRRGKEVIDEMYARGDVWCQETKYGNQIYFKFRGGLDGEPPESIWYDSKFSASEHGTLVLDRILGKREAFPFPKSHHAVMECIRIASTRKDALVLDFFAGSGTTAQAVLGMNTEDGGNRKFIVCTNNENGICLDVCHPRIKKVMCGYKTSDGERVEGMGGNLKYFRTDFVDSAPTDKNKKKIVDKSTEMICIKENAFVSVRDTKDWKLFKNQNHYLGIIFDYDSIEDFVKEAKKIENKIHVYVFSLDGSVPEEEFKEIKNKIELCPIPEAILHVYRRIFK